MQYFCPECHTGRDGRHYRSIARRWHIEKLQMHLDTGTRGTLPIVPTPFTPDGVLLTDDIARLVDYYSACGADGMTILGVFGEGHKLSAADTATCVKEFLKCAQHRLPVIVGVTNQSFARSVELAEFAMGHGAAGVLLQPPATARTDQAIFEFFERFTAETRSAVPVCVMDDPASSGVHMSVDTWCRISRLEPVFMLKHEPVPGLQLLSRIVHAQNAGQARRVSIFASSNAMWLPQELARGADGTMVGVAYSDAVARIYALFRDGLAERAADLHDALSPLIRHEKQGAFGLAIRKEILRRRGALTSAALRYPGITLTSYDHAELDTLIARFRDSLLRLKESLPLSLTA